MSESFCTHYYCLVHILKVIFFFNSLELLFYFNSTCFINILIITHSQDAPLDNLLILFSCDGPVCLDLHLSNSA